MGQTVAAKEGHERLGKRGESFIKGQQGGFAGKGIADQDGNKIDHVVLTKACAGEAHLFLDDFEDSLMGKNLSKGSHFSHPGRSRGLRFRGNLDRDRRMRHTTNVSSLFEKRSLIVFSQGDTFFARAPASLLFSYETSLRIPWDALVQGLTRLYNYGCSISAAFLKDDKKRGGDSGDDPWPVVPRSRDWLDG